MSTPFLLAFSEALVATLLHEGELDVVPGREMAVVEYLAQQLHVAGSSDTLISLVAKILLACPDVEELYADNKRIKLLVEDLRT